MTEKMHLMEPGSKALESLSSTAVFQLMLAAAPNADHDSEPAPEPADLHGWREFLCRSRVQADRVASPNLIGQLEQAESNPVDTLICSVLDTDPSVPLNATIAREFTRELAAGIDLLAKLTKASRVWITADPARGSGWFRQLDASRIRLVPLRGDYPQTDPALMLYTLLQRRLAPGRLPTEKNALLVDAAAAAAVGRCAPERSSVRIRPLAFRDHFQRKTHFVIAPTGTRLGDLCDFLQMHHPDAAFRAGDFLRDQWITRDTILGSGELIIHATAAHLDANPDPCIHCGWCLEACPMRIHPAGLLQAAQQSDERAARRFGISSCIECGICSYVCPTRLPLLSAIRTLKTLTGTDDPSPH